jgi:hypothetical protein
MKRAGIIPVMKLSMQEGANPVEEQLDSIDTAAIESAENAEHLVVPVGNESSINSARIDTGADQAAGSMNRFGLTGTPTAKRSAGPASTTDSSGTTDRQSEPFWAPRNSGAFRDPLVVEMNRLEQECAKREAEDDAWGISLKKLGPRGTWCSGLREWMVEVEDFKFYNLIARSAEDAGAMFCSVCGRSYKNAIRVSLLGTFSYSDRHLAQLLSRWRENLKESFEEWITTPEGRELAYKARKAYNEEEREREFEERMESLFQEQMELEDEYYAGLEAEKRKKQAIRKSRHSWDEFGDEDRYEKYDDGGEDDDEEDNDEEI